MCTNFLDYGLCLTCVLPVALPKNLIVSPACCLMPIRDGPLGSALPNENLQLINPAATIVVATTYAVCKVYSFAGGQYFWHAYMLTAAAMFLSK